MEVKHKLTNEVLLTIEGDSLQGADLRGSNLQDANLQGADLRGAYLNEATVYVKGRRPEIEYFKYCPYCGGEIKLDGGE